MTATSLSTASEHARTAQLFRYVRDAVIMLDPHGTVGFWSAGAARVYGRPAAGTLNRPYLDLLPPACRETQGPLVRRAMDGEAAAGEWQTVGPDGRPMWLEGDFRHLTDPPGCAILLHDVTRWRAAEAARAASEDLLRTVTDNVPGAVFQFRVGPDGAQAFTFISHGVESLLERPVAAMNGGPADEILCILAEDRAAFFAALDRSRETLAPLDVEYRARTARTHRLKWIRWRAVPTRRADGGTAWNGVMKDATDQVAAVAALRESEARYRLLTENATDLIARLTPAGVFVYASTATRALLGSDP